MVGPPLHPGSGLREWAGLRFSTCPLMKRDLRLGLNVKKAAIHWKRLGRGRPDIKNVAAKSVVAKASRHYGQGYCRNERDCGKFRITGV